MLSLFLFDLKALQIKLLSSFLIHAHARFFGFHLGERMNFKYDVPVYGILAYPVSLKSFVWKLAAASALGV